MHLRPLKTAAATAAAALLLAACGTGTSPTDSVAGTPAGTADELPSEEEGTVLDQPFAKPGLVLTDTSGAPYDLVAETAGRPTLLYFGYTNCPDVCPLTLSNIALAADSLPEEEREELRVVFVTSDPERDTPESLGPWLDSHDPDFVGLTGDFATIQEGARSVGVHLDEAYEDEDGHIISTHGTQVLAFLPGDDRAHVLYNKDATVETFERDLPLLIAGKTP
ncbi:SCO family protein [Streptomyces sp. ACA25]|uniref:SCO family protein n=1 Tax=Streptomyces sp. ACA25 TaxID=3022596 RepID=UPI002307CE7E|nr:SCO family protein [Streptomyces sp. ACA25]MDB1086185.1 SCO family protein [Streptomyces sp. ACA25]